MYSLNAKIDHLTYFGGTRKEAEEFYGEILGLETRIVDDKVWVKIGEEFIIHLATNEKAVTGGKCHYAIGVENVYEIAVRVREHSYKIFDFVDGKEFVLEDIEPAIKQFFVRDCAGNVIEFIKK